MRRPMFPMFNRNTKFLPESRTSRIYAARTTVNRDLFEFCTHRTHTSPNIRISPSAQDSILLKTHVPQIEISIPKPRVGSSTLLRPTTFPN